MSAEKAVANVELLSTTQWCMVYSYIHHKSYGKIPINYRKREFMDAMPRKKVRKNLFMIIRKRFSIVNHIPDLKKWNRNC